MNAALPSIAIEHARVITNATIDNTMVQIAAYCCLLPQGYFIEEVG